MATSYHRLLVCVWEEEKGGNNLLPLPSSLVVL